MKRLFLSLLFLPLIGNAQINSPIGTNISSVHDYSTEFVFTDAFKQCREWIPFDADGAGDWDSQVNIPLAENGYPLEIPYDNGTDFPQKIRSLVLWDLPEGSFPSGYFRLKVEGTGSVRLNFGATGTYTTPIDTLVYANNATIIEIEYSDVTDPISNIQFILPDYVNDYEDKTFTDEFTSFLADFQCLRFMDWLRTNFSPIETWEERSKLNYYTQTTSKGVAWEYVIELSNLLNKDIWINVPHKANDTYIEQLANFLQSELNPELKIYVEYSNEVWNGIFSQHQDAATLADQLGYTGEEWDRAWKYTAKRSADIFSIFENTFTDDNDRLIKVIPSQSANSWLSNQIITYFNDPAYNPMGVTADALAIAPYFGGEVANEIAESNLVESISITEIIERMENSLAASFTQMTDNKNVADGYGYDLITYEGGQHLVATGIHVNNETLTEKLNTANHHVNLKDVYCQYFNHWYENNEGLFMHFSSHALYSKWGSWGVKETMDDLNNPKYLALQECVFSQNSTPINDILKRKQQDYLVYPNPSAKGDLIIKNSSKIQSINLYNILGQKIAFSKEGSSPNTLKISIDNSGVYFLEVNGISQKVIVHTAD